MMSHVNCWLLALSFVLGLALTLAFMIRRVKREVPVYDALKGGAAGLGAVKAGGVKPRATAEPDPPYSESKTEVISLPETGAPETKRTLLPEMGEAKTETISLPDAGDAKTETISLPDAGDAKTETISLPGAAAAAGAAGLVGGAALAGRGDKRDKGDAGEEPYGAGSFRLVGGASAPSGWTIKGNEDSMLYHTTDSPSYEQTIAEVWFRDEPTAEAAGFTRWDSGKSQRDK